jgi:anti-sigma factor RsiW
MTDHTQRQSLIHRYLLGRVSLEERAELEDHYFKDDNLFEELVAAENDMIDAYVSGKLSATDREQFESYFLSTPERQERVEFAKSLMKMKHGAALQVPPAGATHVRRGWVGFLEASSPGMRVALATVLVIALAGASWMAVVNRKLNHQLETARAAQAEAQQREQELRQQMADLQKQAGQNSEIPAPGAAILSLALPSDLVRGVRQQQSTLHLSPNISEVRFVLTVDHDESPAYIAVLETAEGSRVSQTSGLVGQPARNNGGKIIIVPMSPAVLKRDDYVVRLLGSTSAGKAPEVGTYSFRVVKR